MAGYIGSKSSVTLVDGYTEAEADAEFVNDPNGAITVSGSNVGIGTDSPSSPLHIAGAGTNNQLKLERTGDGTGSYYISATEDSLAFMSDLSNERMRIDSSGRVGIGTSTSSSSSNVKLLMSGSSGAFTQYSHNGGAGSVVGTPDASTLAFYTYTGNIGAETYTERMRIDSSGNLLVGTTDSTIYNQSSVEGMVYRAGNSLDVTRASNQPLILNRLTNDGTIADFRKDGSVVGTIGVVGDSIIFGRGDTALAFNNGLDAVYPINTNGGPRDNAIDLGRSNVRFDDIYATNGTIQTSDFNEKQDIASLTATEMLVGKRISALFKTFRWKDSVAEKGDNARTHTGVIAQDVQAAFTAEGLDAGDYALFISSTWWETQTEVPAVEAVAEVTDEDGNVTTEAVEAKDAYTRTDTYETEAEAPEGATSKTRLGIRYPELLSFVAAYNEQRFASIEARLTALEA